jgi:tRNA threonylcarbamoyladenosine modification (KEOPS) complex Cgi121 subunit
VLAGDDGGEESVYCCQSDDAHLAELQCSEARRDIAAESEESSHPVNHLVKGRKGYKNFRQELQSAGCSHEFEMGWNERVQMDDRLYEATTPVG